jgi:hypothetical protein
MHSNQYPSLKIIGLVVAFVVIATFGFIQPQLALGQQEATTSESSNQTTSTAQMTTESDTTPESKQESTTSEENSETASSTSSNETQEDAEEVNDSGSAATSTTVETGDAQSVNSVGNAVNTNDLSSTSSSQTNSTSTATSTATSSMLKIPQAPSSTTPTRTASTSVAGIATSSLPTSTPSKKSTTTVTATNTAEVSNEVSVTADTGANTARSSSQSVSIQTGDATAYARILNKVNTNTVNSSGAVSFINNLAGNVSTINLREAPVFSKNRSSDKDSSSTTNQRCRSSDACQNNTVINTSNTATVTNAVTARSSTGGNQAYGTNANIDTGDAYAAADVVNIANTNIIDSSYLLFSFNNFGDWSGNLVFPNKETIADNFSGLTKTTGAAANEGQQAEANAEGTSSNSVGTVIDNSGADVTSADQFMVALQVHGDWTGEVFNAPDILQWQKGRNGLRVFTAGTGSSAVKPSNSDITTDNQADVNNDVEVHALTGKNQATSSTGTSSITTGRARAASNVINVVNTNVVGQNMLLGVLNIFGDWDGNISFGQPDLWVGGVADTAASPRLQPGSVFDVTYDVVNRGDADAHDVELELSSGSGMKLLPVQSASNTAPTERITLPLGDVPAGEAVQVKSQLKVSEGLSRENYAAKSTAAVNLHETDANTENNKEIISLTLNQPEDISSAPSGIISADLTRDGKGDDGDNGSSRVLGDTDTRKTSPLQVYHSVEKGTTTAENTSVTYHMRVQNNSDEPLKKGVVTDRMISENGQQLNTEIFRLGEIYSGEEIKISYTTVLSHGPTPSVTNRAQLTARHDGQEITSNTATSSVQLPRVAGVQDNDVTVCRDHFDEYIWSNQANNPSAVRRLQRFLNEHENAGLTITGRYDEATQSAVQSFQSRYAEAVLDPWGVSQPTGNVYRTTLAKINDIMCGDSVRMKDLQDLEEALHGLQSTVAALPTQDSSSTKKAKQVAQTPSK